MTTLYVIQDGRDFYVSREPVDGDGFFFEWRTETAPKAGQDDLQSTQAGKAWRVWFEAIHPAVDIVWQ